MEGYVSVTDSTIITHKALCRNGYELKSLPHHKVGNSVNKIGNNLDASVRMNKVGIVVRSKALIQCLRPSLDARRMMRIYI